MPDALNLIPAARPAAPRGERPPARPAAGVRDGAFADLLARAASGEIISGAPVALGRGVDLDLTDDQLARLSLAADRAEAEGLSSALVMIDGMSLLMDVRSRTITRHVDLTNLSGLALTGIDGVLAAPGGEASAAPLPPPGGPLPANPDLLTLLATRHTTP